MVLFLSPAGFLGHLGWAFNACAEFIRKTTNGEAIIEEHSFKETSETGITVTLAVHTRHRKQTKYSNDGSGK